jgi:hypothetical protein
MDPVSAWSSLGYRARQRRDDGLDDLGRQEGGSRVSDLARAAASLVLRRSIQSVWILVDLRSQYEIAIAGFVPESRGVC